MCDYLNKGPGKRHTRPRLEVWRVHSLVEPFEMTSYDLILEPASAGVRCKHDYVYRNSSGANSARFRRHTIQVCIPGVSISVTFTPLVLATPEDHG